VIRVLHLSYDDAANPWVGGGGAVRAHEIYRRLTAALDVTVLTGAYPGSVDEIRDGVRYRRVGRTTPYAWSRLTYGVAASRSLRRGRYDAAVLDHSIYTPVWIPRRAPVGVNVAQLPGRSARERWGVVAGAALSGLERVMLRRARTVSVVSEYLRSEVGPAARRDARLFVVPAGVDDSLFQITRREQDYILYYGRFDIFQKGIDLLIEAARTVLPARGGLRLILAGRGRDADRVRALVRSAGMEGVATVEEEITPGRRAELFAGALVLIMPSRFEGFGMVAAEGMAAGVPVVATDLDSLPDVVGAPHAGVLFRGGDPQALAESVQALLDDPVERRRLSEAARVRARRFTWDAVAAAHLEFLQQVMAHR
jgi:glycosyltransferase involved in cell wall biosynthesis